VHSFWILSNKLDLNLQTLFYYKAFNFWPNQEDEEDFIATNGDTFPWEDIRLPAFIKPIRYDIELTPNLTTLWVKGKSIDIYEWSFSAAGIT